MKHLFQNKIYVFYAVLIAITCGALLFTNFSYDAAYHLTMSYRLIQGDSMILEMWEPHQTSAFLCAILMKLYMVLTGTTTGIVIFLQLSGFICRAGISLYLFKTVKKLTGQLPALVAGTMFLLMSPKDLLVPEFSNMQLWFGVLLMLSLIDYFNSKKIYQLILSALWLCMGVLSYPSFIIAYFAVFFLLLKYSGNAKRDILIFTGICALIGGAFVGYLLITVGLDAILDCLPRALAVEPTHTVNMAEKMGLHLLNFVKVLGFLVCFAGIGLVIERIWTCITAARLNASSSHADSNHPYRIMREKWLCITWYMILAYLFINIILVENNGATSYPLLAIIGLGLWNRKLLSPEEKRAYDCGLLLGVMNLLATMILSNHPVIYDIPYLQVAVCISVIPLYHWITECCRKPELRKLLLCAVHAFLLLTIFRGIYIHVPMTGRAQICSLRCDLALIRTGPAIGIITDEEGAARQRDSYAEWAKYIKPGDTVWILGEPVDTLGYLYQDVEVGAPSVISTPTYNSELLYYWEVNPEKYPNVLILSSGFGELSWDLLKNEWLMDWIENEYQPDRVIDGNYWRYYFKD